ncbi:MAG TPA: hypothetical protein PLN30_08275, partial [Ferruginibacter sp.]|nr:hypothetical protein [Ferruginibacter sp.]
RAQGTLTYGGGSYLVMKSLAKLHYNIFSHLKNNLFPQKVQNSSKSISIGLMKIFTFIVHSWGN